MRNLVYLIAISVLAFIFSCSNPCADVDCGPNGTCDEGVCICASGFSGSNCEIADRDQFFGSWKSINTICDVGNSIGVTYNIEAGERGDEILLTTMTTPDLLLVGKVDDSEVTLEPQTLMFGVPVLYSGSGTIEADTLNLSIIQESEGQPVRTCDGTYWRQ